MESAGWSLPRSRILRFPPRCTESGSDLPTGKTPQRRGPLHLGSIASPQTSVPAEKHGGGPGASLSHLIVSLHPDRPPCSSQRTAKVSWPQIFTGTGSGCSLAGGTGTACRELPTQVSPARRPSDHSNKHGSCAPKNPNLAPAATLVPPAERGAACRATRSIARR